MSAPLVFLDTETTGLSLDDDIWEVAAIRREPNGEEHTLHLFVEHDRAKCARLPERFREDHYDRYRDHRALSKEQAAYQLAVLFGDDKPHIVGAVPNFDTERIARLMTVHGYKSERWHYHLIDVENLAVGYLAARGGVLDCHPPWKSDIIAELVGVTISEEERHTALGDARWAMRIYDAVIGGAS